MSDGLPSVWGADGTWGTYEPSPHDNHSQPDIPDQQYVEPLSAAEMKEYRSLQADMGDVRGVKSRNWRDAYWNNPAKQRRFGELALRAEARPPAGASGIGQRANSYLDGQRISADAVGRPVMELLTPERDEAGRRYGSYLAVSPEAGARAHDAVQHITENSEDPHVLAQSFDELSDVARWYCYRALANPHERERCVRDLKTYKVYDEVEHFINSMTPNEQAALMRAMGLE